MIECHYFGGIWYLLQLCRIAVRFLCIFILFYSLKSQCFALHWAIFCIFGQVYLQWHDQNREARFKVVVFENNNQLLFYSHVHVAGYGVHSSLPLNRFLVALTHVNSCSWGFAVSYHIVQTLDSFRCWRECRGRLTKPYYLLSGIQRGGVHLAVLTRLRGVAFH